MLTRTQLTRLRRTPLKDAPNKIALAMEIGEVRQVDLAAAVKMTQASISRIANGHYERLPGETMRLFAEHFGCHIEDLFPSREAVAS